MAQIRNVSNETHEDRLTGQVAKPDEVIDIPDDFVPFFDTFEEHHPHPENPGETIVVQVPHPVWRVVDRGSSPATTEDA